ncbi:hypothetical protein NL676_012788 [Syzygium grande]|nr:hypothetical protein NL676_012788 [Syzygium grande]
MVVVSSAARIRLTEGVSRLYLRSRPGARPKSNQLFNATAAVPVGFLWDIRAVTIRGLPRTSTMTLSVDLKNGGKDSGDASKWPDDQCAGTPTPQRCLDKVGLSTNGSTPIKTTKQKLGLIQAF